ncbi:MAG TPA: hypothetical protein DEA38_16560 [Stenotrophomonas sp.]|nr:hypothetical protein [Stenotrophomonas sp.]
MPVLAMAFLSTAVQPWNPSHLDALVDEAAAFNREVGVTGVLLFDGIHFLQYLEGPAAGLDVAFARVQRSPHHMGPQELGRGRPGGRLVPDWPMRWLLADPTQLRRVVNADWSDDATADGGRPSAGEAIGLLQAYLKPFVSPPNRT